MFSNYLKSIEGVGIYPLVSLLVFFLFFIALLIWVVKVDKKYINKMSQLPLESDKNQNNNLPGDYNDI